MSSKIQQLQNKRQMQLYLGWFINQQLNQKKMIFKTKS